MVTRPPADPADARVGPVLARMPDGVAVPDYDPEQASVGQLHLGLGGFHRAHQAVYTDRILAEDPRWGISAYTWRNEHLPEALTRQNGLYGVLTAADQPELRIVGALRRARSVLGHAHRFAEELASPAVTVVTLTVTEKAYPTDPGTGGLDVRHAAVAGDLDSTHPRASVIGLLTRGLADRARRRGGPLAVISCDNLRDNGALTRRLVTEFAAAHPAYRAMGLASWIDEYVTFPSTVVDRIVPNPDGELRARVHRMTGWHDHAPVMAEPYMQWVVQDRFHGPRPPWERAGVLFVPDVKPWEELKLRVLNAAHTALAYPGLLEGHRDVHDAITDPRIGGFVRALIDSEILPHLPRIDADVREYAETVLDRFANPALSYSLTKLGADGSQKLRQRLVPTALDAVAAGTTPHHVAAVVAWWTRWIARCAAENPVALADPHAATLLDLARSVAHDGIAEPGELALRILDAGLVCPADLAEHAAFRDSVVAQARSAS